MLDKVDHHISTFHDIANTSTARTGAPLPNAQVGLDMGLLLCKAFGPTIREVCGVTPDKRLGVDMAFEQRRGKCEAARMVLQVRDCDGGSRWWWWW
jgi:hypothetical protein